MRTYLIDQHVQRAPSPSLHQLGRIVVRPCRARGRGRGRAHVARQRFLAPGAGARVRDRGEGADGFVEGWVFEELGGAPKFAGS